MIENVNDSIFNVYAQGIVHQANCFNTMNSGVAKQIRQLYPEAYEADCKTIRGDQIKLGTFSFAKGKDGVYIYNCYSQYNYGKVGIFTQYNHLENGLKRIKIHASDRNIRSLAVPYGMGCVRGGGDWKEVSNILSKVFDDDKILVYICKI